MNPSSLTKLARLSVSLLFFHQILDTMNKSGWSNFTKKTLNKVGSGVIKKPTSKPNDKNNDIEADQVINNLLTKFRQTSQYR